MRPRLPGARAAPTIQRTTVDRPPLLAFALLALFASRSALGARPFNTDDARVVDPGGYQIESFVKVQGGSQQTEFWLVPAANFGGALERFEFTMGGNYIRSDSNGNSNLILAQVKALLKPLQTNGVGFALSVGVNRTTEEVVATPFGIATVPGETSNQTHYDPYLNAISSLSVRDDAVVFHLNAGATRDTLNHETIGNWGIGAEIALGGPVFAIAETYGVSNEKPSYQVGIRYWVIPARLQVDGTYGWQLASPTNLNWISIGLRVLW